MEVLIIALVLGIVEGLTEFLPVSSTGHLIMVSDLLHLDQEKYASFNIIIQLGAILAVVFLYSDRFKSFLDFKKLISLKDNLNQRGMNAIHVAVAILPALAIGYLSRHFIKAHLFNSKVVVGSLIIVGIIMIIVEKIKPAPTISTVDDITYKDAFIVGLCQCFALVPGVSRSGATMLGAMGRKIDVKTAADFSFLISVPVITIATVYEFLKSYHSFSSSDALQLLVGFVVSFIVAIFAVKGFLAVLKKLSLTPFAIYRIIVAVLYAYFRL